MKINVCWIVRFKSRLLTSIRRFVCIVLKIVVNVRENLRLHWRILLLSLVLNVRGFFCWIMGGVWRLVRLLGMCPMKICALLVALNVWVALGISILVWHAIEAQNSGTFWGTHVLRSVLKVIINRMLVIFVPLVLHHANTAKIHQFPHVKPVSMDMP